MPRIITYSLELENQNSDGYYHSVASFTDHWTPIAVDAMKEAISGFHAYRQKNGVPVRSDAEYALELLALGVLLQRSRILTSDYPLWSIRLLSLLIRRQQRWPRLEPVIKNVRGLVQGVFIHDQRQDRKDQPDQDCVLTGLINWLTIQGETSIMHRLAQWQDYLKAIDPAKRDVILSGCLSLSERFAQESNAALGKYTDGVQAFLEHTAPGHRWEYDSIFVSRTRTEYHLGMLATEVLNRAYRQRFLETRRKVVIVPPCMREQPDEDCKAIATPLGSRCQACKPGCRVHHVTKLGEKLGFDVFIIPDELRGFGAEAKQSADSLGLVGVSCALTNWSGGWDAEALGVPAQGLLLDYVGCRYHWDREGISTDTNLAKLKEILGRTDSLGG